MVGPRECLRNPAPMVTAGAERMLTENNDARPASLLPCPLLAGQFRLSHTEL